MGIETLRGPTLALLLLSPLSIFASKAVVEPSGAISYASTTALPTSYSSISFGAIETNPEPSVSHNFRSTRSAVINGGVAVPIAGFRSYARSGFVDVNGAVLGELVVREAGAVCAQMARSAA